MPFFLTVLALLAIWILYGTIRMAIDPKYREEQIAQAKKARTPPMNTTNNDTTIGTTNPTIPFTEHSSTAKGINMPTAKR